jgi:hypothetical protein
METDFRKRIDQHVEGLPNSQARFSKFFTSPFVLMIHSRKQKYRHISEIEADILPAKLFSSMETSAGRMVEQVVLPVYDWEVVPSAMHTSYSAIDGKSKKNDVLCLSTLKSGPRCLNDEMSENFADVIIANCQQWATDAKVSRIDFSYGVLYGTKCQSNKKDWHILRNIEERLPNKLRGAKLLVAPAGRWNCSFKVKELTVEVTVRIGSEWWSYLGGDKDAFMEIAAALIRACITPSDTQPADHTFTIADLPEIISLVSVPKDYNVGILQRSQLEWLFFYARHFCDKLVD